MHIICDKPLTATVEDALKLEKLVKKKKVIFALTHNYSAYPMLREAKSLVDRGKIGKVLLANVEYPPGLYGRSEEEGRGFYVKVAIG